MDQAPDSEILIKLFTAIAIVAICSLIAFLYSKSRFRAERRQKKKVAAYERVIGAFQDLNKFVNEQMAAKEHGHNIDNTCETELRKLENQIFIAFDIGKFMLSDKAIEILGNYEMATANAPKQDRWYEHIESASFITNRYKLELMSESHRDVVKKEHV